MSIKLTRLASQNPWWKGGDWGARDPDLKRIEHHLERPSIDIPPGGLTLIRGVRRSGKTVYLKSIVKQLLAGGVDGRSVLYLSCDRVTRGEARNIIADFLIKRGGGYLLLDEVTYMDGWNLMLKELMEEGEFTVIATGSNPVSMKDMAERLPGRGVEGNEHYFDPLSFRQFVRALVKLGAGIRNERLREAVEAVEAVSSVGTGFTPMAPRVDDIFPYYNDIERLFYAYLLTGGFPDAVTDYLRDGGVSKETYETLIRVILGTMAKDGKSEEIARVILGKLLELGAGRTDYISIAKDAGVHHNTVREYLDLFESSRLTYTLYCWDLDRKRHAVRKQKKVVFQSPLVPAALRVYLTGGGWEEARDFTEENSEWLVEGAIAAHLIWTEEAPVMREKHAFAGFHYGARECDLVILRDGGFQGFESKYGKLERRHYRFPTIYLTKDTLGDGAFPASLFLFGLEKGSGSI